MESSQPRVASSQPKRYVHVERLNPASASSQSYLVADLSSGEAAILDPVDPYVSAYLARLDRAELRLVAIVDTHTHGDHVSGAPRLSRETGAPIVMHHDAPRACVRSRVRDGDEIVVGALRLRVLETPGHTYDGISLAVDGVLFVGDLLELGDRGHAGEACGDARALAESLGRLSSLDGQTRVYGTRTAPAEPLAWALERARRGLSAEHGARGGAGPRSFSMPADPAAFRVMEANLSCDTPSAPDESALPGEVPRIDPDALAAALRSERAPVVVDVRSPDEFFEDPLGRIPGALLVPLEHLAAEAETLRGIDAPLVVTCRTTARAVAAASVLAHAGLHDVVALTGGVTAWRRAGHPVERDVIEARDGADAARRFSPPPPAG